MKFSREFRIGIVVLLGIATFVWGYNFIKGTDILSVQHSYYAVYARIDGLVEANPVLVNGLKIGHVKSRKFIPGQDARIVVEFTVDEVSFRIPDDSRARIVGANLMGDKAIDLLLGTSGAYADYGDTLKSDIELSITDQVAVTLAPLQAKANNLLGSLDSVLAVVQYIFNQNTRDNIRESFVRIKDAIKNFENTSVQLDTMVTNQKGNFASIIGNITSISSNIQANNQHLSRAIQNFANISDTLARANLAGTIENVNRTMGKAAVILQKIESGEGSAGMLVSDSTLYMELSKASRDLNALLEDMKANPKKYVRFSLISF